MPRGIANPRIVDVFGVDLAQEEQSHLARFRRAGARKVLVLYRKRPSRKSRAASEEVSRFRYSDLKGAVQPSGRCYGIAIISLL